MSPMAQHEMFKDWLAEALERHGVSRRELARRLAESHPSDAETQRRSIRRILNGEITPTQPTRDAIQAALNDRSGPAAEDEARGEASELQALVRDPEFLDALMPVARLLASRSKALAEPDFFCGITPTEVSRMTPKRFDRYAPELVCLFLFVVWFLATT